MATKYKLKLDKLNFISPVDRPAQETATVRLIKRADGSDGGLRVSSYANVVKVSDELGLVFCWAFTSTQNGADYHDLQGDAIDHDFVKAAADFMLGGGLTDEMHDRGPDGKVAFLMPMTPEIAAAYGVTTKTTGLMCALKPSPEVFAKFKTGEYTGVSIDGEGFRTAVKRAADTIKMGKRTYAVGFEFRKVDGGVMTSETSGHQHTIAMTDFGCEWIGSYFTSYQTMAGAEYDHCHPLTFDLDTGDVTIGEDSGHSHTTDAKVPSPILALVRARMAVAALRAQQEAGVAAAEVLVAAADAAMSGGAVIVQVAARAPTGNSTPSAPSAKVASQQETPTMLTLKSVLAAVAFPAAHQAHLATLDEKGAEEFLAKSAGDREALVKSALDADPIAYTTKAGHVIRKSHGPLAKEQAEQIDKQAEQIAKQSEDIAKANAETERVSLEKRAVDPKEGIPFFKGDVRVKSAILGAVEGIKDEVTRKSALESLRGANAMNAQFTKSHGTNEHNETDEATPIAKFDAGRIAFAKLALKTETPSAAQIVGVTGAFISTTEGGALYHDAYPPPQRA